MTAWPAMSATPSATEETLPRRIEKPWGHEIWWAATDQYVGKILHVNKGHRLSLQYHEKKDEPPESDRARALAPVVVAQAHDVVQMWG